MSQKLIIDVVGLPGCGKSTLCNYLCDTYGFTLYRPSDVLREYAKQHNITLNSRQDYIDCHEIIIKNDPLAMIEPVVESDSALICMDGLRAPAPFLALRKEYGAKLIYMDCPLGVRFDRTIADITRKGHRSLPTIEAFEADELADYDNSDSHLPNVMEMKRLADYTLDASGPFDDEVEDVKRFLAGLGVR